MRGIFARKADNRHALAAAAEPASKAPRMKTLAGLPAKMINGLSYISGGLAALSLVAAAVIITEGVVVRKVLGVSTIWQIEASVYLLIYACFVGAAFAQMHDHHLNVDLVIIHLSRRTREITLIIVSILSCLLCALIAWYAWPMWYEAFARNDHSESLWGPPLWIPYFFLPLGMTLLFLQYLVYIANKIALLSQADFSGDLTPEELKYLDQHSARDNGPGPGKEGST